MSNKENLPPTGTKNPKNATWHYCYFCRAQTSHSSNNCTSKWKLANHKDEVTFKDIMGESKCNMKYYAIYKIMS